MTLVFVADMTAEDTSRWMEREGRNGGCARLEGGTNTRENEMKASIYTFDSFFSARVL